MSSIAGGGKPAGKSACSRGEDTGALVCKALGTECSSGIFVRLCTTKGAGNGGVAWAAALSSGTGVTFAGTEAAAGAAAGMEGETEGSAVSTGRIVLKASMIAVCTSQSWCAAAPAPHVWLLMASAGRYQTFSFNAFAVG